MHGEAHSAPLSEGFRGFESPKLLVGYPRPRRRLLKEVQPNAGYTFDDGGAGLS
jgi:hypothetical protein